MLKKTFYTLIGFIIFVGSAYAVQTGLTGVNQESFLDYIRHHDVEAGAATLGPSAPTPTTIGTARCLAFGGDTEEAFFTVEIPPEWNGTSDMKIEVDWHSQNGDIIANGETVKLDMTYYSVAEGEAVDNGTVAAVTTTFTGGASETDKEYYHTSITLPYNSGNQPLSAGDDIHLQFDRDVSGDTYSGDATVCKWELEYTANQLATH